MPENPPSPGQRAFEKACRGEGLTPEESQTLAQERGITVEPTIIAVKSILTAPQRESPEPKVPVMAQGTQAEQFETNEIDALMQHVETSFAHFYGKMRMGLDVRARAEKLSPVFWKALENPSHIIQANRTNPLRNAEIARKSAEGKRRYFPEFIHAELRDPRHFVYDIEHGEAAAMQGYAGFAPKERRMVLQRTYDERNPLDFLAALHETVHVMHTAFWLMQGGKGFVEFYDRGHPAVILNEEFDAYALEIEALNLLLSDDLRRAILSGQSPDAAEIARRLRIDSHEETILPLVLRLSGLYFPSGTITQTEKPSAFIGQIAANQKMYGYDLFMRKADGQLQQIGNEGQK